MSFKNIGLSKTIHITSILIKDKIIKIHNTMQKSQFEKYREKKIVLIFGGSEDNLGRGAANLQLSSEDKI